MVKVKMSDFWRIILSVILGTAFYMPGVYVVLGGLAAFGAWKLSKPFDGDKRTGRIALYWFLGLFLVWVFVLGEPFLSARVASGR